LSALLFFNLDSTDLNEPFKGPSWFDIEEPYVFVEDDKVNHSEYQPDTVHRIPFPQRTSRTRYNEVRDGIRDKYILYSPSGGFSKQRVQLEYALFLGQVLNRTVFVPLIGRRTTFWFKYNAMRETRSFFPMDRILDFEYMSNYGTRIIPLNITLTDLISKVAKEYGESSIKTVVVKRRYEHKEKNVLDSLARSKRKLLYFKGDFQPKYYKQYTEKKTLQVRKYIRFSKLVRVLGTKIAATLGNFNAIYVPFLSEKYAYTSPHEYYEKLTKSGKYPQGSRLYVATEPKANNTWFSVIRQNYDTIFWKDLPKKLSDQWRLLFPSSQLRRDMIGILEQVILSCADNYRSNEVSYFSEFVEFMRNTLPESLPELYDVR